MRSYYATPLEFGIEGKLEYFVIKVVLVWNLARLLRVEMVVLKPQRWIQF